MAVAAAVAQFGSGSMTLGVSTFDQLCWLPFPPFVMCDSYVIIMARCINWSPKTQCIVPLSFHSLSNTALLHRRGLLSHVFCSSVCVVLAALVQTAVKCSHLWVWTLQV